MEHVSGIVRDILARLEKDAIFQTEGEPDGRPYLMEKRDEEVDPIKRVLEQCRAKERLFQEEHDGMSSAEYFWESGYSDAEHEAMRERDED
jgi:hypothetical protein